MPFLISSLVCLTVRFYLKFLMFFCFLFLAQTASDWRLYFAGLQGYFDGSYFSDGVPITRFILPFVPGSGQWFEVWCNATQYGDIIHL